jgi:hypothetical protein
MLQNYRSLPFVASVMLLFGAVGASADLINEFQPNPSGTDPGTQDIELTGAPFAAYSGFLISIDSDGGPALFIGTIDRLTAVSGNYDVNGLAVETVADLENPSFTLVFSTGDGGGLGTDLDVDGDGVLDDVSGFGTVYDAVSIPDAAGDEGSYAAQLGGVDFTFTGFEPELAFRELTTGTWIAVNDLDDPLDGIQGADGTSYTAADFLSDPFTPTFGRENPAFVPEPSSLLLCSLAAIGLARRRS